MAITSETKILTGVLLVTLLLIIGGSWLAGRNADQNGGVVLSEPVAAADRLSRAESHATGSADASVTVVEFGDFQCPACRTLQPVLQQIRANNPDIRFVWRHFPLTSLHEFAQGAAEAAEAAGAQGKFFEYHDLLFANQEELARDNLLAYAEQLGLDVAAFGVALDGGLGQAAVQQDLADGTALGVKGTPTLFINDRHYSGQYTVSGLQAVIDALREGSI